MAGRLRPSATPPFLSGPSTRHEQGVLRAGGSGGVGASLARLARAPQFPGVTCESPPATSSALFLFTFPLPPASRLTQRRDPSVEPRQSPAGTGHPPSPAAAQERWGKSSPLREVPSTHPPCAPHQHIPTKGCCSRAIPPLSGLPASVPPNPISDPRHKPAPVLPWLLSPRQPPPTSGWVPGGLSGRSLPLPTHTYAHPAPAERQAGA